MIFAINYDVVAVDSDRDELNKNFISSLVFFQTFCTSLPMYIFIFGLLQFLLSLISIKFVQCIHTNLLLLMTYNSKCGNVENIMFNKKYTVLIFVKKIRFTFKFKVIIIHIQEQNLHIYSIFAAYGISIHEKLNSHDVYTKLTCDQHQITNWFQLTR